MIAASLGIATIAVAAWVSRHRILEEYWLYRLRAGDAPLKAKAAARLGELGSRKAVPALLGAIREECVRAEEEASHQTGTDIGFDDGSFGFLVVVDGAEPFVDALIRIDEPALPALIGSLGDRDTVYSSICAGAIWALAETRGLTGSLRKPHFFRDIDCLPILERLSEDGGCDEAVRQAAVAALKRVQE